MNRENRFAKRLLRTRPKVRYAVVGAGHIAQNAVLPAFKHAKKSSVLAAIVSGDAEKREALGKRYRVPAMGYDRYDELLASGEIDAVYIALPNDQHRSYAVRAARAGVHVLCEKPLAVTVEDCLAMIRAAEEHSVKLMTAYRLHFEPANLHAISIVRDGVIGEPKIFSSDFCMQVKEGDIRTGPPSQGGGPIYDLGVYCINAARYLFRDEPVEAMGVDLDTGDPRFRETVEATSAILRFPRDRVATFTVSNGASDVSSFRIIGTKGDLRLEPAYEYEMELGCRLTVDGKTTKKSFPVHDQFAPELVYFSDCIREDREPEPSGIEGLADLRILEAIQESVRTGGAVRLAPFDKPERPVEEQEIVRPAITPPPLVATEAPHE